MQLIQLSEASIDTKKTMSTLEEVFESNQIKSSIADIENDVCAKISPNKNDTVSVEDVNRENITNEQIYDTVKNLNGVTKSNGHSSNDGKILAPDNDMVETEQKEKIENRTRANLQSNESSAENQFCKSPTSIPTDMNINLEVKLTTDSNDDLENAKNLMKKTDVSLNDKDVTDIVSCSEKSPTVVDTQENVCNKQVSDAENTKDIEIPNESEDIAQNLSAFSPNSDTNEKEVNISEQLQQLEDDESMEEVIGSDSTISEKVTEVNNHNLASQDEKQKSEFTTTTNEQKANHDDVIMEQEQNNISDSHNIETDTHIDGASTVPTENLRKNTDFTETCTDENLTNSDTILDKTSSSGNATEKKLHMDVVHDDCEISDRDYEKKEVSTVMIKDQSDENDKNMCSSNIDMDVDLNEPIPEEKLEENSNVEPGVDKISPVQKYITVKKFNDMTYPAAPTSGNCEETEIFNDKQPIEKDQLKQNEVMNVDVDSEVETSEKSSLDTSTTTPLLPHDEKKIEIENNVEILNIEANKNVKQQMAVDQKNSDNVVMEIDDNEEVPVIQKPSPDTELDKDEACFEVKNCNSTTQQDTVINIIDNEDEEKSSAPVDSIVKNDETSEVISIDDSVNDTVSEEAKKPTEVKIENKSEVNKIQQEEENKIREEKPSEKILEKSAVKQLPVVCKLSNTMDILSDEEDDPPLTKPSEESVDKLFSKEPKNDDQNKCINLDDDDDIMFIEDTNSQDQVDKENKSDQPCDKAESPIKKTTFNEVDSVTDKNEISTKKIEDKEAAKICEDTLNPIHAGSQPKAEGIKPDEPTEVGSTEIHETKPLITKSFLKSVTKNLAEMTRDELEDFCILKLVESVVDKSNLKEINIKMKTLSQTLDELRKKAMSLTKQNRDLQVVVKTVQEDQKKRNANPMMPMKITRSVGLQVVMNAADQKSILKKKLSAPAQPPPTAITRPVRNMQSPKTQKIIANNIPVPRLVPASSPNVKSPVTPVNTATKITTPTRNTTPQRPEKRPHSKPSPSSSVTVDLTDDEPPAKINTKNPPPPVRLVPSQNLMAPKIRPHFGPTNNSPRKVYIPISSNNQNIRPGQAVIKNLVPASRPRQPSVVRMQTVRLNQAPSTNRHPAPLPDAMKQYQPPTWKALPPAPDLKLSKVDNGIVISWKFEGYQPDTYEEVASFQLYAYQETPAPPSTALWKKIGDIKALPLPMACTLTQFMSGFKYYFAVRAIDVRSRIGPFSLPGSIMLISKT